MTATIFENGLRARLHRLARGSVVFAIVLGACAGGAASAFAADEADSDDAASVELHVSAGVRGVVAPGSATTASLTVQNDSANRLGSGRVVVELNRTPLSDEAEVDAWLADSQAEGEFDEIGADTIAPVDPEGTVSTSLLLPPDTLGALAPGVYPLRAVLSGADDAEDVTSTSVLVVTASGPAPVSVIVPLTATPANGSLLTADELSALTAADGALTAALDGVAGTAAVLAVDPSIPAAIRVLGTAAPAQATEWLRRLDALPNERFALQFGDADATTQTQAGLGELLQPTTLTPFLNPSNFSSAPATPDPEPTSTDGPEPIATEGPALPDDETLTAVERATPGILWPRSDVTLADLTAFEGYLGEEATTVLSSSAVNGEVGAHATVDGSDVLVIAQSASDALSRAATEDDTALRQGWLAEANAHLYLSAQASGGTPLLVGLDRDDDRPADALRETIAAIDSLGVGLQAARTAPPATVSLTTEPDSTRGASLLTMLDSEVVLGQFASILDDAQLLLSPKRIQIMRATAVGLSAQGFVDAVEEVDDATTATLESVYIPPASTIQLLSANADLPFSVRNDLPWPVDVRLSVFPSDARLDVEPTTTATIQPGTTTRVKVPVSARVGSGEVTLRLELSSPTGVPLGDTEQIRVSVRAEWETIGLAVFGGLIVLLIGLGIIRTVRRNRREAQESQDPPPAERPDAAPTDAHSDHVSPRSRPEEPNE